MTLETIKGLILRSSSQTALALSIAFQIVEAMYAQCIECDEFEPNSNGFLFKWTGTYNVGHYADIAICNDGHTTGFINAGRTPYVWGIREFETQDLGTVQIMTLAETLEHIRHVIWANHS